MKPFINDLNIAPEKRSGIFLLVGTALLGLTAQTMLLMSMANEVDFWTVSKWFTSLGPTSPVLALSAYICAGVLLVIGLQQMGVEWLPDIKPLVFETKSPSKLHFGFWLTSFGLAAFIASYTASPNQATLNGYGLAFLWLVSIALFGYSVLKQTGWQPPNLQEAAKWLAENRYEVLGVLLILILAWLARTIDLELHPYSMVNDEGEMGKGAICLLRGGCPNIFSIAWASQPLVAYLPYALSVAVLGNMAALPIRLVSVVTGVLAVLFTYLFVRENFDKKTALVAAILLGTFPFHLHFSRIGVDNIVDSLSSALLLWLIFRGIRKNSPADFLAAGIVTGLCFYTYPGSRLAAALGAGVLGYHILTRRGFLQTHFRNLLIYGLIALIVLAPIAGAYSADKNEFNARINEVGLVESGALRSEMQSTGASAAEVVFRSFLRSSFVFITAAGPMNFYNTPRAYFSTLGAIALILGLVLILSRAFDPRNITLLAWFFAPIILGSTLTSGAPSNQRMLGSSPAAVILAALALVALINGLQKGNDALRRVALVLLMGALLYNGTQDILYYFGEYRSGHYFEDLSNEITYESHPYISSLGDQGVFYLIGDPMTFTLFGNFGYFAPDVAKVDFKVDINDMTGSLTALSKDKDALFLAIPYRKPELEKIAQWLPGGEWIQKNRRYQTDQELFYIYKVSKEQLQAYQP